jgi:serine/threonine protein kinase
MSMDNPRKRISNFHLSRLIYDGERCEVYEARYAQAGGVVQSAAVKVLKPEFACIGEELRSFLREIDWARMLRHSLFPRIMEAGEHDGHYFLAMERLEGWTLEVLLRDLAVMQLRLPCQVALTLIHQIADGLQSVHEHCADNTHLGVVHLGIEPSNIMMRKDGAAAVLDFGESMAAGVGDIAMAGTDTTAYQAPERLRMLPLDRRADIYSLGKVLEDMTACMDPVELGDDLPVLIARACSTHLEERFSTMRDLMDAIEVVARNRNIEFSCHACSRFGSEVFGESDMRTDPRAHRPRAAAAPMRMPSEGMATAHGLPMDSPSSFIDSKTTASEADSNEMITEKGGPIVESKSDTAHDSMLVEPTELSPQPRFVDEHLAVTAMSAPHNMEELAASQESTRVSTAHIEAAAPSEPKAKRKKFPEELVATKAYSLEPDTDEELASAIERLRTR